MKKEIIKNYNIQSACCDICGKFINKSDYLFETNDELMACKSIECQFVVKQKNILSPVLFESWFKFQKKVIHNRLKKEQQKKENIERIKAREEQQNHDILKELLVSHPDIKSAEVESISIPCGSTDTGPIPEERKQKYIGKLIELLVEADKYKCADEVVHDEYRIAYDRMLQLEEDFNRQPAVHETCDRICTICQGGCCVSGKEHAYQSVFNLRRYKDEHPELSNSEIVDVYVSYIPDESVIDGCVNQTKTGCSLPRKMRSSICNGFYCQPVKHWMKPVLNNKRQKKLLVVQRAYNNWAHYDEGERGVVSVSLLDENGK